MEIEGEGFTGAGVAAPGEKSYACVSSQSSSVYSVAPSAAISINA
jgi:hypothetical protein